MIRRMRHIAYLKEGNNPDEPGWFIQWLQSNESVHTFSFDGAWYDIGTPESYLDTVSYHLDGGHSIADSATVEDSQLGTCVQVMPGAEVVNASLERTIVFPDATVSNATLEDCIVDRASVIDGIDIGEGVIGPHTELKNEPR